MAPVPVPVPVPPVPDTDASLRVYATLDDALQRLAVKLRLSTALPTDAEVDKSSKRSALWRAYTHYGIAMCTTPSTSASHPHRSCAGRSRLTSNVVAVRPVTSHEY